MRGEKLVISGISILSLLVPLALAQEPSPGGGGYFDLSGIDSFALCPDNNSLDKDLGDFSIEAWIYPRREPKRDEEWIIAAKPGSYDLTFAGPNRDPRGQPITDFGIIFTIYWGEAIPACSRLVAQKGKNPFPDKFKFNEWHHIVARFHEKVRLMGGNVVSPETVIYVDGVPAAFGILNEGCVPANTESAFCVGGIEDREGSYFDGCIDRLRISNVPRPEVNEQNDVLVCMAVMNFVFDQGRETLGMWHFDEPVGAASFHDASGNGNTLFRRGAGLPVASVGKLPSAWAVIKSGH